MTPKGILKITSVLFVFWLCSCKGPQVELPAAQLNNVLKLTAWYDAPGVYDEGDGHGGFYLELLRYFAEDSGYKLITDKADGSIPSGAEVRLGAAGNGVSICESGLCVLTTRRGVGSVGFEPAEDLPGKKVILGRGVRDSDTFGQIIEMCGSENIHLAMWNDDISAERLDGGSYDFLICEKTDARRIISRHRNIRCVHEFAEPFTVYASFSERHIGDEFARWYEDYKKSNEYTLLTYVYFSENPLIQPSVRMASGGNQVISEYDQLMRHVAAKEGMDWRLLSAIAYNESRFTADIVSHRGAVGLMQIMPHVARQYGVSKDLIADPEINITLAARILKKIEKSLHFPAGVPQADRTGIILASYNCGIGHVLDARRLAVKYGYDPNKWSIVAMFLERKADPEYHGDDIVTCGNFRGSGQTLGFVSGVMRKYDQYCQLAQL